MPHLIAPAYQPPQEYVERKRKQGLCKSWRCLAKSGKGSAGLCYRHYWQHKKRRDPIAYIFHHKRQRAIDRGKNQPWGDSPFGWGAWTITLDNFRDWCLATGYHTKTGRTASSMSLDRKDNAFGYHIWNLRPLTLGQNSAKSTKAPGGHYEVDDQGVTHYVFVGDDGTEYPF